MKFVITGSRDFKNPFEASLFINRIVAEVIPSGSTVIHGNARGADRMAAEAAKRHGSTAIPFDADWDQYGKRAGYIRNREMLDEGPDRVIAFWDGSSRGTKDCFEEAVKRGIPTQVFKLQ